MRNLRRLRKEYGVSQKRLADVLQVSQPSINKYENNVIEPNLDVLTRMADYFDTSVDYLIGHTESRWRIEPVRECALNDEEEQLIARYRRLSKEEKACVTMTVRTMECAHKAPVVP